MRLHRQYRQQEVEPNECTRGGPAHAFDATVNAFETQAAFKN